VIRAAFFDVGDTLVEGFSRRQDIAAPLRGALVRAFGEREWYERWIAAEIEPAEGAEERQETLAWYRRWFEREGIALDGFDLDRFRATMCLPLADVSTPVAGALDAVRWCRGRGLRVVLVTNTLSRGDAEVLEDWRGYGLADSIDGVVSSHSVGWRKPHPAMFERALSIAGCAPAEAFMVGDNLRADVWGAKRLGLRAIWRRTAATPPDTTAARRGGSGARPSGPAATVTPDGTAVNVRPDGTSVTLTRDGTSVTLTRDGTSVTVTPDATIDDLTEIPAVVAPWLS